MNVINPTDTLAWEKLRQIHALNCRISISDLFKKDTSRFTKFSISFDEFLVDFSKNTIDKDILDSLIQLANEMDVANQIKSMFLGHKINFTENRAVLHTALRSVSDESILYDSKINDQVKKELFKIKSITDTFHAGELKGFSGKTIDTVVNIGVGGSDLGPLMVVEALRTFIPAQISIHFISNVDGVHLHQILERIDIEKTIFLIASKTFTTQETMTNAYTIRERVLCHYADIQCLPSHFFALTGSSDKVDTFGIPQQNIFHTWDWVGGRFSLWSSIGLSISLAIGFDKFTDLLEGANGMDTHFKTEGFESNIPVILALIDIWHVNFRGYKTQAILPYDHGLSRFPAFLQQLGMESNGKTTDKNGKRIKYATSPVIWGEVGTNGQHSFYQLIQQGSQTVPCDFIGIANSQQPIGEHHNKLMANFFAQTEGFMLGKTMDKHNSSELTPHKIFEGGVPTNSILIKELTPKNLGALIAIYEHKTFVLGAIWNINSFDQWGVEFGKKRTIKIFDQLESNASVTDHDASTNGLINQFKIFRTD